MLKSFLTGVGLLLATLCPGSAAAGSEFVTAGFSYAAEPVPVVAQSIWFAQPAGQEFVSAVPRVDFIDLQLYQGVMPPGTSNHYKVILRADTITGPFVWVSETVARPEFDVSVARFFFDPPVELTPWARYVFEVVRVEPIEGWQDAPGVGFVLDSPETNPTWHYGGGRAVWEGATVEDADMYFRAGVLVPPMLSTNAVLVRATGTQKIADPGAVFTNQFITSLDGSTLECRMDLPLGTNDDIQFNSFLVHVDPVTRVLSVPYDNFFRQVGVVLTNAPGDKSALVVRFTTDAPTYVVGLVLGGVEFVARPDAANGPWPAVRTNTLRATFRHSSGEVTEAMRVDFQAVNQPPVATASVIEGSDFLGRGPAFFTQRTGAEANVSLSMEVTDVDSSQFAVRWQENGSNLVTGAGLTWSAGFRPGVHLLDGTVQDEVNEVTAARVAFEVMTPREGMERLRTAVRHRVAAGRRSVMATPLLLTETAVKRQHWNVAEQQLRVFQRRVQRQVQDEDLRDLLDSAAQALIDEALAKPD